MNSGIPIMNKAFIDGRIYDVIELNELGSFTYYGDSLAIHYCGYVLPFRMVLNANKPGVYTNGLFYNFVLPSTPEDAEVYSDNHLARFGNASTFRDIVEAREKIDRDEYNHLVSKDNIFVPNIDMTNDSPLMIALKTAVTNKSCNINNYSERFGQDFNNDRRKFNGNDITAAKYSSIGSNMDIRTTLIVEDMNPNVANPMGNRIVLTWVGDGNNDTAYEDFYRNAIAGAGNIKL